MSGRPMNYVHKPDTTFIILWKVKERKFILCIGLALVLRTDVQAIQ